MFPHVTEKREQLKFISTKNMLCISEVPTSSSTAHSFLENVKRTVEKILLVDRMSAHKAAFLEAISIKSA